MLTRCFLPKLHIYSISICLLTTTPGYLIPSSCFSCRSCFPRTVINRVLLCGLHDFYRHGDTSRSDSPVLPGEAKVASVVGILGHLAGQHSAEIQEALVKLFQVKTLSVIVTPQGSWKQGKSDNAMFKWMFLSLKNRCLEVKVKSVVPFEVQWKIYFLSIL